MYTKTIDAEKEGLNAAQLKLIAILCMVIDHVAWTFVPLSSYPVQAEIMHFIGRFTFPIMCFFIGIGYRKSHSVPKYLLRLFILAAISVIPFCLLFFTECGYLLDTIFTLFFGLAALYLSGKVKNKLLKGFIVIFFMIISIIGDAGVSGVLLIYIFGIIEDKRKASIIGITSMNIMDILITFLLSGLGGILDADFIISILGTFAVIPLIVKYNGQRGKKSLKYFFYIFYPAHMFVLLGLRTLCS